MLATLNTLNPLRFGNGKTPVMKNHKPKILLSVIVIDSDYEGGVSKWAGGEQTSSVITPRTVFEL